MSYCPATNSKRSYDVAIAALREICVRNGSVKPHEGDLKEQRWAREGPVPNSELESARHG